MPKIVNRFTQIKPDAAPEPSESVADMFKRKLGWKPMSENSRKPDTSTCL